ncbi:uncharacterized protein BDW70DRAFT_128561 [Aspergillus foveolatus]|uniref:uncharacterized protein n=1 Tax=Aspergillus foveolatus TaxID=210207 RepID=UPI003CCE53A0
MFGSRDISWRMVACAVDRLIHADSVHLSICILININTPLAEAPRRRNWKAMNRPKFTKLIEDNPGILNCWRLYGGEEVSIAVINAAVNQLVRIIRQAIEGSTPWANPSA